MKRLRKILSSGSSSSSDISPDKKCTKLDLDFEALSPTYSSYINMTEQLSPEPIPVWAQGMMADIKHLHSKMDGLSTTINGINKTINGLMDSVDHANTNALDAKKIAEDASKRVDNIRKDFTSFTQEQDILKGKILSLNEYVLKLECQSRRSNLKLDNVPEYPNESPKDTERIFREILQKMGHLSPYDVKIERCHRTGPKGEKPRTIIIKFNWYGDRQELWEHRNLLHGSNYWLREDFPAVYEERRRILHPHFQAAKHDPRFQNVSLHIDKLSINGRLYSSDQINQLPDGLRPDQIATKTVNDVTLFFRKESFLSNFHPAVFKVDNISYSCSEQFYQAKKAEFYGDDISAGKIMATKDPVLQYVYGKQVKGFKQDPGKWFEGPALKAMEKAVCEKFSQNRQMADALKATPGKVLAEASPTDRFWGIGLGMHHANATVKSMWRGQNKLGSLLTALRNTL